MHEILLQNLRGLFCAATTDQFPAYSASEHLRVGGEQRAEESQRATDPARAQTHGFQPQCWLRWMANSVATLDLTAVSLRWI